MEEKRTNSSALQNTGKLSILKDEKESENYANLRGHQAVISMEIFKWILL